MQKTNNATPVRDDVETYHFLQRRIVLMFLSAAGAFVSFIYILIFEFLFDYRLAFYASFIHSLLYLANFIFIRYERFEQAKHFITIIFLLQITEHAVYLFPHAAYFQMYFLVGMPLIYMLFARGQGMARMIYSAISISLLLFVELTNEIFVSPVLLTEEHLLLMKQSNIISSLFVLSITIYLFVTLMENAQEKLREQANTDVLTGLYNRRYFFTQAKKIKALCQRNKIPFSMIFIDLDYFKNINDLYGHDVGDQALWNIANIIINNTRDSDVVARVGGEEFVVMFINSNIEQALTKAEQIRRAIHSGEMPIEGLNLTASMGVTAYEGDEDSISSMIMRADSALYEAKDLGRNCVVMSH